MPRPRHASESTFGAALDEHLTRNGFTLTDLANMNDVTPSYISRLRKTGRASPHWVDILADTLRADTESRRQLHAAAAVSRGFKF